MRIRKYRIYLTEHEMSQTRDLVATQLSCGHNVIPRLKNVKYMQHVHCDVCRKTTMVMADQSYDNPETLLRG